MSYSKFMNSYKIQKIFFMLLFLIVMSIACVNKKSGSVTLPTVVSTDPEDGAVNVSANKPITATFSVEMDEESINEDSFIINKINSQDNIKGTITFSEKTSVFIPASKLSYKTTYRATIAKGVSDTQNNLMAEDYTWTFTTGSEPDTIPPTVVSVNPEDNIPVNSSIAVIFSEDLDSTTINADNFYIENIPGTITYSNKVATFTPLNPFEYNSQHVLTISKIKDLAGNMITPDYTFVFTTESNTVIAIASKGDHTICLKKDGSVWGWGNNFSGQLSDASNVNIEEPLQLYNLTNVKSVSAGFTHNLVLKNDSTVCAWGGNDFGQMGDSTIISKKIPVEVKYLTGAIAISSGKYFNLCLKKDGTVWAWGSNNDGQLGDSTEIDKNVPIKINVLSGITAINCGANHSLCIAKDGTVWAWGNNSKKQLSGKYTYVREPSPIHVEGLTNITAIAGGVEHSIVIKSDSTVWAWGGNNRGQLGDGTGLDSYEPVKVEGVNNVIAIAAGDYHSICLKKDGTVWAWGNNYLYQLGDSTNIDKNIPVQVKGLSEVVAISSGAYHNICVKKDGTVWTWGYNESYQLGDKTTINRNVPVQVKQF